MKVSTHLSAASLVALAAALTAPASAWAQQADKAADAAADTTAEVPQEGEIIVTASRREESIRKTPVSVTAYSGKQLQEAQITSLPELVAANPNIKIASYTTNSNIAIRGIGNTQIVAGSDPGVALHLDGVYLAQSALATATFLDVERVEILRGPQGTLFGRNATGGLVNIIPNRPTATPSGGIEIAAGMEPGGIRSSAFVSGPLGGDGQFRGRLAVQQNYNSGFTENIAPGRKGKLDGQTTYSVRGQLQWLPSEDFNLRLSLEHSREDDAGPAFFLFGTPDPSIPLPAEIAGQPGGDPVRRRAYANQHDRDLKSTTALLVADWALGSNNLKAFYSYNETRQFASIDGDATPVDFTHTEFDQSAHQHYAELVFASDASRPFSFIVGTNFFRETFLQDLKVPISFLAFPVNLRATIDTTSFAAFARGELRLAEGAKIFGGLRYSDDKKSIDEFNVFLGSLRQRDSWNRLTYEVGASYDLGGATTTYLKYATGYKSGGFSMGALAPSFAPETDTNLEFGVKGSYLNGRVTANLALFHMKYDDLQVSQVIGVVSSIVNAAKATIDGAEVEIVVRPTDRLRLDFAGSWLNARFDSFFTQDSARPTFTPDCRTIAGAPVCGIELAGNRLPQAPRLSLGAGASYKVPLGSAGLTFAARYDWRSRVYFTEFNIPVTSQRPAGTLDLSVRYESGDGKWNAGIFARNVADKSIKSQAYVNSALLGSLALGQLQPGRQIGVSIGRRF